MAEGRNLEMIRGKSFDSKKPIWVLEIETRMGFTLGIAWDVPKYVQSEVLQLIPRLTPKTLQNWLQRGLLKSSNPGTRGKGDHRKYSPIGIVMLDFVATLTAFGVPLASSFSLAEDVADAAEALESRLADWPSTKDPQGVDLMVISEERLPHLQRGIVQSMADGTLYLFPADSIDGFQRVVSGGAYLVVEHEMRIIDIINRMRRLDAGEALQ